MSLHYKIVWLFVGVAVVPLLIFALYGQRQTLAATEYAAEVELVLEARSAAGFLSREAELVRDAMELVALDVAEEPGIDSLLAGVLAERLAATDLFEGLEVIDGDGNTIAAGGPVAAEVEPCVGERFAPPVRRSVPIGDGPRRLVASYRPGQSLPARLTSRLLAVESQGRSVVWASTCDFESPPWLIALAELPTTEGLHEGPPQTSLHAASAPVQGESWVAVAASSNPLRAPVRRLFRNYWLFVIGLALTTIIAFSMLLGRATRSLYDLTAAVERVGEGDLQPWLPPPGRDEVGRLTVAFSGMVSQLRETMQQIDRTSRLAAVGKLTSYLSHEIRNPLSGIKMNLQRLERWERSGELPERTRKPIQVSLREVERLSSVVAGVLQLRPEAAEEGERVSVHELIAGTVELLEQEFETSGVVLELALDAPSDRVIGRPHALKGVFINLVLNALHVQPDGGRLSIRSEVVGTRGRSRGPSLELQFADAGPGIPPELRARVFEPFFTTREGGSGIGLAVASQTVRDHGGRLYVREPSSSSEGATLVVELPLAPAAAEAGRRRLEPQVAPWLEP